jgi:hypothetical protein
MRPAPYNLHQFDHVTILRWNGAYTPLSISYTITSPHTLRPAPYNLHHIALDWGIYSPVHLHARASSPLPAVSSTLTPMPPKPQPQNPNLSGRPRTQVQQALLRCPNSGATSPEPQPQNPNLSCCTNSGATSPVAGEAFARGRHRAAAVTLSQDGACTSRSTPTPEPGTRNRTPEPGTRNSGTPEPETEPRNPEPGTRNPEPGTRNRT